MNIKQILLSRPVELFLMELLQVFSFAMIEAMYCFLIYYKMNSYLPTTLPSFQQLIKAQIIWLIVVNLLAFAINKIQKAMKERKDESH